MLCYYDFCININNFFAHAKTCLYVFLIVVRFLLEVKHVYMPFFVAIRFSCPLKHVSMPFVLM